MCVCVCVCVCVLNRTVIKQTYPVPLAISGLISQLTELRNAVSENAFLSHVLPLISSIAIQYSNTLLILKKEIQWSAIYLKTFEK